VGRRNAVGSRNAVAMPPVYSPPCQGALLNSRPPTVRLRVVRLR
jgi:hypothetical protein